MPEELTWTLACGQRPTCRLAEAAKTVAGSSAGRVTALAHQIHGAIGVTTEYPLSQLTRRLWAWRAEYGTEEEWSRAIGQRAIAHPEGVWGLTSVLGEHAVINMNADSSSTIKIRVIFDLFFMAD